MSPTSRSAGLDKPEIDYITEGSIPKSSKESIFPLTQSMQPYCNEFNLLEKLNESKCFSLQLYVPSVDCPFILQLAQGYRPFVGH